MMTVLAGIVLFIACANASPTWMLSAGPVRCLSREIAIRLALGVSRARLLRLTDDGQFLLAFCRRRYLEWASLPRRQSASFFSGPFQIPTDLPVVAATELRTRRGPPVSLGAATVRRRHSLSASRLRAMFEDGFGPRAEERGARGRGGLDSGPSAATRSSWCKLRCP